LPFPAPEHHSEISPSEKVHLSDDPTVF
jgi:hypothetical protein